ncbi:MULTISPECIES: YebC/PmpR family DNA-binding transcriptional regulator [Enterococcus]|jgi:YebC/PmpR family DNA-binding regulatory protein|uniref:Probable transcriptional regulatory protein OMK_01911 n=1 Tax=Enterococcus dispar ATCC 51266 TaxID=1139219 RepID=S0K4P9_9ENTE|nr:YebC/PmpR family DNA-binding transcriptional regulator [Enterococcus dispar]EOT40059.1 YebC/PmpR family DNA-binding regulatory protein [Enterococcus dispar ATCC 51266]EOW86658.1 YebC/PmpR family DNA-binding regulatory protein [Enterococcus dispar ATCC 51266]MCU7357572.1 YebC/PmpR family DNA-binding transcriptional regulator [Enterococcus dispar]MDT2705833.1 YebC/PmpR family DNA-binding transcriptional regulator [Enterococcus dispar]OJG39372.1 YebC/PmpR family DNA-binding regulatory protein 
MSGHSKWNNIQGRKNAQDAKRGKIFQKLSREIYMAAKSGGGDVALNPALRLAVDKAKAANMPNDNVDRAIKKATSSADEANYDEVTYEGYGPGGVAILVHALTDNRNRTATNVRVAFTRNGGNLGETGSVNYLFERKGYIAIEREGLNVSEETMFDDVLEAGAEDLISSPEVFEIYTAPEDFTTVRDQLEKDGFTLAQAELTMLPQTTIVLTEDQKAKLEQLVDKLEDDDDVAEVFTSLEN